MEKIEIGKIVNAVALKGEVKVLSYAQYPENFEDYPYVLVKDVKYEIESVRVMGQTPILKLKGVNDRTAAELLKGKAIFITDEELPELEEGEYYVRDLIGMEVVSVDGEKIGVVKDVIMQSAQSLYEVERADGKLIYIPGVPEFLIERNVPEKKMTVKLPEGLLDL